MLVILLIMYSLGISLYLLWKHRTLDCESDLDKIWNRLKANASPSAEELKLIAKIAKVRQKEIPWYERSISTIGIVAFFSMIIATSVQTIGSAKAEVEAIGLRQEINVLEGQRDSWTKLVKELSEVIILKQSNYGRLEKSEEDVLKQRLVQLEGLDKPGKDEDAEKLKIYLALKLYSKASALIEQSSLSADDASPENLLFLAEINYLDGAKGRAKSLLKKFESGLSKQPAEWQLRFFVLSAALNADPKAFGQEVASLKHIQLNEAEDWLQTKVDELREQARRRSLASAGSPEQ